MKSTAAHRVGLFVVALSTLLGASLPVCAQDLPAAAKPPVSATLIAKVNSAVDADTARLTAIFKDLHQHPEIAFTEVRTAAIVAKEMKSLGFVDLAAIPIGAKVNTVTLLSILEKRP